MSRKIALTTALFASLTLPALAEGQMIALPVGEEILAITLPPGFAQVAEGEVNARLAGETAEAWTEIITLTVDPERGFQDPTMDLSMLGGVVQALCPDTLEQSFFGSMDVPGTERGGYGGWNSCGTVAGSNPPYSEQYFSFAVSGEKGMYVLTWQVRGPASEEGLDYDSDMNDAQIEVLTTGIKVCPMVAGEAAPYPSCIGG